MQLLIECTVRPKEQMKDVHVRYLWAYVKYLIRITDDEDMLRRLYNIIMREKKRIAAKM